MNIRLGTSQELRELVKKKAERCRQKPESTQKVTALIVEPGKIPYVKEIGADYNSLFGILEGPVESINPFRDEVSILCNELGKVFGLPSNRALFDSRGKVIEIIAGTFIVIGTREDSESYSSLTEDEINQYSALFRDPECRWRYVL